MNPKMSWLMACVLVISMVAGSGMADLEAYYPLDVNEGLVAPDHSGNDRHGTLMGGPTWVPGAVGSALNFDGVDDYVNIDGYKGINVVAGVQQPFSIANWVKTTVASGNTEMVTWGSSPGGQRLTWRIHEGRLRTEHGSGNLRGNIFVNDDEWHHVALTVQEGANLRPNVTKLYVNGQEETYRNGSDNRYNLQPGADVSIGRRADNASRYFPGSLDDVAIYSHVLSVQEIQEIMLNTPNALKAKASQPTPGAGAADVPYYVNQLGWGAGDGAVSHNVYYSTNADEVTNGDAVALIAEGLADTSLEVPATDLGTTYFWRVDEVAGDGSISAGFTWSFTTEAEANLVTNVTATSDNQFNEGVGAQNTVNGSGLTDGLHGTAETDMWLAASLPASIDFEFDSVQALHEMHIWNQNQVIEALLGFGAKDVTIEISADGETFTAVDGVVPLNQGPAAADYAANNTIAFNGALAKVVRLTIISGHGPLGQAGLSEVQFTSVPAFPREFSPASGSDTDDRVVSLSWRAGRFAAEHQVLVSADRTAIEDGSAVVATTSERSHTLTDLDYGQAYFWQIIDVTADGIAYPGPINLLFTPSSGAIDDFESYSSDLNKTWKDGAGNVANGASVGAPEMIRVYEGGQALALDYNMHIGAHAFTTRTYDPPLDLTVGNPDAVGLYILGSGPTSVGGSSATISAWGADIWNRADEMRFAYKKLSGDGSITAKIESLTDVHEWAKAGVMVRDSLDPNASNSFSFVTPRGRAGIQFRTNPADTTHSTRSQNNGHISLPFWVRLTRTGNTFLGERSEDGVTWGPMFNETSPDDPAAEDVNMVGDVYIGLAVTSHTTSQGTTAEFSNVSVTGSVGGGWTVTEVGGFHPVSNDPAKVSLEIVDSKHQAYRVTYPDSAATNLSSWTLFEIPFSKMKALNLKKIQWIKVRLEGPQDKTAGTLVADFLHVSKGVGTPANIWLEAEGATVLGASWRVVEDANNASGGLRVGSEDGDGNDNGAPPDANWIAAYDFDVPQAGIYNVILRGMEAGSDSFWVRILGAQGQSLESPNAGDGWVRFNGFDAPSGLTWDKVHSDQHGSTVVKWVLPVGPVTMEVGKREDGVYMDAFLITNDLALDQSTLPAIIP